MLRVEMPSIRQPSPGEDVGVVVDNLMRVGIKFCREVFLRKRHTHRVREPLAERAGGRFHAGGVAVFGVPGCFATELAEIFDFIER